MVKEVNSFLGFNPDIHKVIVMELSDCSIGFGR